MKAPHSIADDDLRALVIALSSLEYRLGNPAYQSEAEVAESKQLARDTHQLAQDLLHRGRPERLGAVKIARYGR